MIDEVDTCKTQLLIELGSYISNTDYRSEDQNMSLTSMHFPNLER